MCLGDSVCVCVCVRRMGHNNSEGCDYRRRREMRGSGPGSPLSEEGWRMKCLVLLFTFLYLSSLPT